MWFYSSARWQENENYVAGLYYNANEGDPTKWLYVPDPSRRAFFHLDQHSVNTRLTWQAAQKHKLAFYYDNQWRVWDDGRAGVSPESFVNYRFPALNLAQATWTSPLTSRLLLEVKFSNRREAFGNKYPPEGGDIWLSMIPVMEQSSSLQYRGKGRWRRQRLCLTRRSEHPQFADLCLICGRSCAQGGLQRSRLKLWELGFIPQSLLSLQRRAEPAHDVRHTTTSASFGEG